MLRAYDQDKLVEFIRESNAIEQVYDDYSLEEALLAWQDLKHAYEQNEGFTSKAILSSHKLLMRSKLPMYAGIYRQGAVYIGGNCLEFNGVLEISRKLEALVETLNATVDTKDAYSSYGKMELARAQHVWFEFIHPFMDGNGRIGRMLYNLHRLSLGLDLDVIYEETKKQKYYRWFQGNLYTDKL